MNPWDAELWGSLRHRPRVGVDIKEFAPSGSGLSHGADAAFGNRNRSANCG